MPIQVVFETHSTTHDNEAGRATGWLPGRLSVLGREQAAAHGRRRANDRLAAVFSSDLARSLECALNGADLRSLVQAEFDWRDGWEFSLDEIMGQSPQVDRPELER